MFKIFCIESYRQATEITANETLALFSVHGVSGFLDETFEMLHTQDTEYILDSIKELHSKDKDRKMPA